MNKIKMTPKKKGKNNFGTKIEYKVIFIEWAPA